MSFFKDRAGLKLLQMGSELHANGNNVSLSVESMEVSGMMNAPERALNGCLLQESSENGEAIKPSEAAGYLPRDIHVCRQDVVRCSKYKGLIGIVTEVAGDSDSDSSSSDGDDDDDDDDDNDSLLDGQVRVTWMDHSETKDSFCDIEVVDREFLHGDIVAAASDPTGQRGIVIDVDIMVDLLAANGEVIKDIPSRCLQRVSDFTMGDYVLCGSWLGRVDDVVDNVTVMFDDGSVCKVFKADPLRLLPVSKNIVEDAQFSYHPGQRVRACSSSVFKNSTWISGLWKASRMEGTVIKVQVGSVFVYWVAAANTGFGSESPSAPLEEQDPKNLKLLSCFSHANWQLGDWCMLPSPTQLPSATVYEVSRNKKSGDLTKSRASQLKGLNNSLVDYEKSCCTKSSVIAPKDAVAVIEDLHTSEELDSEEAMLEKDDESGQPDLLSLGNLLMDGPAPKERVPENNRNCQSCQILSSMDLERVSNMDGDNETVGNSSSPEFGSCSSSLSVSTESVPESWSSHRKKIRKLVVKRDRRARRRDQTFERALLIVNTSTKVDVVWQDGTRDFGLESKTLIPIDSDDDHEFYPEQYVVEKALTEDVDAFESVVKRVGIVKIVNAKQRTASVRWLKPVARPEDPREFDNDEVVSAYELEEHPDYDYCYGDIVVRLSPVSVATEQRNNPAQANSDLESRKLSENKKVEDISLDENGTHFSDLLWVGNITGLKDGDIEVTWADGTISTVGPQAIFVVGRDDDDASTLAGSGSSDDDAASWETVDEDERDTLENVEEEAETKDGDNNLEMSKRSAIHPEEDKPERNRHLSIPLGAIDFVTKFATSLFSRGRKQISSLGSGSSKGAQEPELQKVLDVCETVAAYNELASRESNFSAENRDAQHIEESDAAVGDEYGQEPLTTTRGFEEISADCSGNLKGEDAGSEMAQHEDSLCIFKHFDIARDPIDHHFLNGNVQNMNDRKWVKKVQHDWSILEKNLPDGIYVRVYEDRMDLLRAVIVGPYGTPYQDGLFFFDFQLPSNYPQLPPSVYYHSGGLRVNPNLYENGKVCLSLLNTWTGKGNEVWDPSSSSILQVLVSLQGLVLNSKPYFNEAGYDKQVGTAEGEKNSLSYNENSFLLNCRSMLYLLRRPPRHFEELVKEHFQRRGYYILKACDAYMNGCLVGSLTKDAFLCEKSVKNSCSVGFKLMLTKIVPRLVSALREVGVDCQQFEHLISS